MAESQSQLQKDWELRITRAKAVREEWAKEFRVDLGRKYFRGIQNPGWNSNEWITVNKIYAHLRDQLPTLYSVDPFFYVKLKRSFSPSPLDIALFEQRAKIRQSYLNYLKGEIDLKPKVRLAILDAQFEYGVLKSHYSVEERDNPDAGEPILSEDGETQLVNDDGEPLVEPDRVPVNERYKETRVHPGDFIWDEDAGPLEDKWHWVAEKILLTKEDAEADPRIKQAILETAPPASEEDRQRQEPSKRGLNRLFKSGEGKRRIKRGGKRRPDEDTDVWVAWEIYDLKHEKWLKIVEGASEPIIEPQDLPPGIEKHPYSILRFLLLDDSPYPIPPISQALDPQREFNIARSQILRHRKRFNRKYEVVRNMLEDDEDATKLETGDDGTILFVKQLGAASPIKDAPLDQSNYTELLALQNDMVEIMGSPAVDALRRADSATAASGIDRRLEIREGDDLSTVVDFTVDIGRKLDMLVQANITRDEAVKISGPQGEFWELVKANDFQEIQGEFEYSVNVGASLPRLPQIERAQLVALLQVFGAFPHIMTRPALMKQIMELHRFDNELIIKELIELGQQIVGGQMPMPGASGSQAGVTEQNPITQVLGRALGNQGGLAGGGGSAEIG